METEVKKRRTGYTVLQEKYDQLQVEAGNLKRTTKAQEAVIASEKKKNEELQKQIGLLTGDRNNNLLKIAALEQETELLKKQLGPFRRFIFNRN